MASSADITLTTTTTHGNPQAITLSTENVPTGIAVTFEDTTIVSGDPAQNMNVALQGGAVVGDYIMKARATGTNKTKRKPVTIHVIDSSAETFLQPDGVGHYFQPDGSSQYII